MKTFLSIGGIILIISILFWVKGFVAHDKTVAQLERGLAHYERTKGGSCTKDKPDSDMWRAICSAYKLNIKTKKLEIEEAKRREQ